MKVYTGAGLGDVYYQLLRDITEHGRKIVTRGKTCLELPEPITLEYTRPGFCWMRIPGRKFNPFFALAEVMWILSGNGNVEWISYFNKRMRDYSDGKEDFHGAYGVRIRKWIASWSNYAYIDQIECAVNKLRKDPFSRQAVISLWDPDRDNPHANMQSKDIPCNNLVYYSLRNEELEQTVVIRSNDVVWGTPYNAIQFTHLQALVAGMLGARMGKLTYVIQNLHYYLDEYKPTLSNLLEQAYEKRIQAESIPSFETVSEDRFRDSHCLVERILRMKDGKETIWFLPEKEKLCRETFGYWGYIIPRMILIYTMIKENHWKDDIAGVRFLENVISTLGQPLVDLIIDFYQDSKNETAQQVLQLLQVRKEG